jgi:hypothetical protein
LERRSEPFAQGLHGRFVGRGHSFIIGQSGAQKKCRSSAPKSATKAAD